MNKRQAKRLLNVAKALRESPHPKAFTMDGYILPATEALDVLGIQWDIDNDGNLVDPKTRRQFEQNYCGTPACALGHYGARTDLQRLMKIDGKQFNHFHNEPFLTFTKTDSVINYDNVEIQKHFGITFNQAYELFSADGCGHAKTPLQAAKYIEKFVRKHYGLL